MVGVNSVGCETGSIHMGRFKTQTGSTSIANLNKNGSYFSMQDILE